MTTFAESMKREMGRVAKKELKDELAILRKASTAHRSDIAALKKHLKAQDVVLRQLVNLVNRASSGATEKEAAAQERSSKAGFDHKAFIAHRHHLGLTQAQMAKVVGVSSLSIYKWESGKVTPRSAQLQTIDTALKLSKRRALELANA